MAPEKRPGASPAEDPDKYGTVSVFELKNLPETWPDTLNKQPLRCHKVSLAEAPSLQICQEKAGLYPPGEVVRRLDAGREAFAGEVETTLGKLMVTYGWVALTAEPLGNTGCSFDPPPGDAYLYDFATVPQYRGQGFYPALLRYILGELAGQGIRRAWITTAPGNHTSVHSIRRAGFTLIADADYIPAGRGYPARFELLGVKGVDSDLLEIGRRAYITNP